MRPSLRDAHSRRPCRLCGALGTSLGGRGHFHAARRLVDCDSAHSHGTKLVLENPVRQGLELNWKEQKSEAVVALPNPGARWIRQRLEMGGGALPISLSQGHSRRVVPHCRHLGHTMKVGGILTEAACSGAHDTDAVLAFREVTSCGGPGSTCCKLQSLCSVFGMRALSPSLDPGTT